MMKRIPRSRRAARWLPVAASLFAAAPAAADVVAIEGAKVHARPGETLEEATVVLRDGAVEAVGEDVDIPGDARRVDGGGREVTAGFVDPYSRVGMVEVDALDQTDEGRFSGGGGDGIHAAYRVVDGYNPRSLTVPIARRGGITAAVAVPQGGLVAGSAAWMSLAAGGHAGELARRAPAAVIGTLGAGAIEAAGGARGMAALRLRELLTDTAELPQRREAFERGESRELAADILALEAMAPVVEGDVPLVVAAHRASDIRVALNLADEFDLDLAIAGAAEAWMLADELADAGAAAIVDPSANLPQDFDQLHARGDAAAILADAGVDVALFVDERASAARTLRQRAGLAVARGMSRDAALAAITTVPAALYGVEDTGAVEAGYRADLVVWSGDPFELGSSVEAVFIGGDEQPTRTRQTELLERYRELE